MGVLDVLCFSSLSAAHCSPSRMGYRWEARSCSTAAQYCRLLSIALPLELARVVCGNGAGVLPRPLHAACLFVCVVCLGCCRLPASARVGDTDSCSRGEVSLHRLCRVSCLRAFFRRGRTTGFCFGLRVRVFVALFPLASLPQMRALRGNRVRLSGSSLGSMKNVSVDSFVCCWFRVDKHALPFCRFFSI